MWFKKASPRRQAIREDVAEAGSISVRLVSGIKRATGSGRLSGTSGSGTWRGTMCSGTWTASRI